MIRFDLQVQTIPIGFLGGCRCVSGSEALSVDMDAEEEGGSEVDMMLGLGSDIFIMELF
jgi:hypothetical protein